MEKYANVMGLEFIFILEPLFEDRKVIPLGIYLMCCWSDPPRGEMN